MWPFPPLGADQSALENPATAQRHGPTFGCVVTVALSRICLLRRTADRPLLVFWFSTPAPPRRSSVSLTHSYTTNAQQSLGLQNSPLHPHLRETRQQTTTLCRHTRALAQDVNSEPRRKPYQVLTAQRFYPSALISCVCCFSSSCIRQDCIFLCFVFSFLEPYSTPGHFNPLWNPQDNPGLNSRSMDIKAVCFPALLFRGFLLLFHVDCAVSLEARPHCPCSGGKFNPIRM